MTRRADFQGPRQILANPSATKGRVAFFARPRQRTFAKQNCRLTTAKRCSTRERTFDLIRIDDAFEPRDHAAADHPPIGSVSGLGRLRRDQLLLRGMALSP